jgi:hypothetical protein
MTLKKQWKQPKSFAELQQKSLYQSGQAFALNVRNQLSLHSVALIAGTLTKNAKR